MSTIKFYILFNSLITFIISITPNLDDCQKIQCYSEIGANTCIKVDSTISLMNPCPESKMCDTFSEDPIIDSYCVEKEAFPFKKLPSLPCKTSEECISGNCDYPNQKCFGTPDGDECNKSEQCYYGKTCRKKETTDLTKKCLDPLKEGEECELDTDCEIDSGCMNGNCTKYFSLENFEQTGGLDYNTDFNFCKSGYVNEVGICMNISLKNETTECSDLSPCEYEYKDENNTKKVITINTNCLCGYNPFGKQYCLIGSGNTNYTRYLAKLKKYHLNNENCHLSERTAEGCQKDILLGSKAKLQEINELINSKYWAKANNRVINAPECVFSVELPDYDRTLDRNKDPEPIKEGQCAKYFCKGEINGGICALSNYTSEFEINVTLANVCSENIKCQLNGEPNDVFYNKTNVEGNCSSNILNKRYPGEKCEIDSECIYPLKNPSSQFHKCEEGICNGMEKDGICEDNSWCKVGLYCDKHEGKCKEQAKKGEKCLESKDCKNNLVCISGKCDELFSLADGKSVPANEDYEFQKKFCKNGEAFENKCVSFNDLDKKVSDDTYKKCDFNSYCEYKINGLGDGRKKYVRCGCGYNSEGQGYCPHFHDYSKDDWEEYRKIMKDKSDNKCHTESRFDCYENDEEEESELKTYRNKLEKGHLFYKCVECAKKVLKDNHINMNKLLFIILGFSTLIL